MELKQWGWTSPSSRSSGRERRRRSGGSMRRSQVADAMHLDRLGRQFDVITDSGLFHVFSDDERPAFVTSLRSVLRPGGMYYMMCFSDRQPGDWGPRRVSKAEIRASFTDGWSVRSIEPAQFVIAIESERAQAWLATIERV